MSFFGRTEIRRSGGSLKKRNESILLLKTFSSSCPLVLEVCSTFSPLTFDQNGSYSLFDEPPPPLIKRHLETPTDPKCMDGYMEEDSGIIHCLFSLLFYAVAERVCFLPPSCYSIIEVLSEERGERGESLWRGEEEESDSGTHTVRTRRGSFSSPPREGGRRRRRRRRRGLMISLSATVRGIGRGEELFILRGGSSFTNYLRSCSSQSPDTRLAGI